MRASNWPARRRSSGCCARCTAGCENAAPRPPTPRGSSPSSARSRQTRSGVGISPPSCTAREVDLLLPSAPSWTCTPARSSAGWSPPAATPRDRLDQPTRRIRDRSPQVAGFNCPEEVDRFRAAPGAARGGRSGVPSLPAHRRAAPRDGGRSGCGGRDGGVSRSDSRPGLPGRAVRSAPGRPARERCRVRDITPGQRPICTFSAREHTTDGLHAAPTAAYAKRDPSAANQPPSTDGEGPDR